MITENTKKHLSYLLFLFFTLAVFTTTVLVSYEGVKKDIYNPLEFLTPIRFDIAAKYIYAKYRELQADTSWHLRLYGEHLHVFNNFREHGPIKKSLNDYIHAFNALLSSIKQKGFDSENHPIPIDSTRNINNGSHRIAACILLGINIPVFLQPQFKATNMSSYVLRNMNTYVRGGLQEKYLDAMALQFCELKNDSIIITVFPSAVGKDKEIKEILNSCGEIVYEKKVQLQYNGAVNLIKQTYDEEPWLGSWKDNFAGAHYKTKACFPSNTQTNPMRIFLFSCNNKKKVKGAKEQIRNLFGLGNHSVHSTDTHKKAITLARILFVNNSIHFLNYAKPKDFKNFNQYLSKYKEQLNYEKVNIDCFCIDGSTVLSAYGLRDCADLDYLHHGYESLSSRDRSISSHNGEIKYHAFSKDDIIFNPENHFYYKDVKFAALHVIRAMKVKRNEKKDQADVVLIDNYKKSAT